MSSSGAEMEINLALDMEMDKCDSLCSSFRDALGDLDNMIEDYHEFKSNASLSADGSLLFSEYLLDVARYQSEAGEESNNGGRGGGGGGSGHKASHALSVFPFQRHTADGFVNQTSASATAVMSTSQLMSKMKKKISKAAAAAAASSSSSLE